MQYCRKTHELLSQLEDTAIFLEALNQNEQGIPFTDGIIAGGFARRIYMIQNDIPINENDYDGDIDFFIPVSSIGAFFSSETIHARDRSLSEVDNIAQLPSGFKLSRMVYLRDWLVDEAPEALCHPLIQTSRFVGRVQHFQSRFYRDLASHYMRYESSESYKDIVTRKEFYLNTENASMTFSLSDKVQFITKNVECATEMVHNFDIEESKFIIRYPYTTAEYIGDENALHDLYTIDNVYIANDYRNIYKSFHRFKKYSNYGFVFTNRVLQQLLQMISDEELDNLEIQDFICYSGSNYV